MTCEVSILSDLPVPFLLASHPHHYTICSKRDTKSPNKCEVDEYTWTVKISFSCRGLRFLRLDLLYLWQNVQCGKNSMILSNVNIFIKIEEINCELLNILFGDELDGVTNNQKETV